MALADHRVGLGVITTPLIWAGASPLIAYNVAFLASFFLSAAAGYALSLAVTGHRPAAFVGGLVFGFHPFRAAHLEHVELLSSYWLAVALLCLHRWVRTRSRWPLAGLALVLTLQALTSGYYFFYAMLLDRRLDRLVRAPPIVVVAAGRAGGGAGGAGAGDRAGAVALPDDARRARVGAIRLRSRAAERRHRRLRRDAVVPRSSGTCRSCRPIRRWRCFRASPRSSW